MDRAAAAQALATLCAGTLTATRIRGIHRMHRRSFLQLPLLAAAAHSARATGEATTMDLPLEEATIDQIGSALRDGRASALALVHAYGARIASLDRTGPTLKSVIELNPDATAIAQGLDDE